MPSPCFAYNSSIQGRLQHRKMKVAGARSVEKRNNCGIPRGAERAGESSSADMTSGVAFGQVSGKIEMRHCCSLLRWRGSGQPHCPGKRVGLFSQTDGVRFSYPSGSGLKSLTGWRTIRKLTNVFRHAVRRRVRLRHRYRRFPSGRLRFRHESLYETAGPGSFDSRRDSPGRLATRQPQPTASR